MADDLKLYINDPLFPMAWEGWDGDDDCKTFYNAKFLEDFGIFKKDEIVPTLTVDWQEAELRQYNDEGNVIRFMKWKVVPVER